MWQVGVRKGNLEFLRNSLSICRSQSFVGVESSLLNSSARYSSVIPNHTNNFGCSKPFSTVHFPSSFSHPLSVVRQQQQQQQRFQQQQQQIHTSVAPLDDDEERSNRFRDMWKGLKGGDKTHQQPDPPLPPEQQQQPDSPLDAFLSSIKAHNTTTDNQQFPRKTPRELKKEQQEQEKKDKEEEERMLGEFGELGGSMKPLYSPTPQGEAPGGIGGEGEVKSLREQQKEFEREVVERAMVDYRETVEQMRGMEKAASLKPGQRLMLLWYIPLLGKIKQEIAVMTGQLESKAHTIARHAPLFIMLGPEKLAVITLHSVLGKLFGAETGKASLSTVLVRLADLLEAELNMERIAKQNPKAASSLVRRNKRIDRLLNRTNQILEKEKESKKERLSLQAAAVLVDFLVRTACVDVDESGKVVLDRKLVAAAQKKTSRRPVKEHLFQLGLDYLLRQSEPDQGGVYFEEPSDLFGEELEEGFREGDEEEMEMKSIKAFQVKHIKKRNATKSILELDERVLEMTEASFLALESSLARHLPMVVPPRPWTNPHTGGYLLYPGRLVRPVGSILQNDTVEAATKDMRDLYEVITILGKTPWKINTFILDVVEELWKRGGGQGEIPSAQNIPLPDSSYLEEKGEGAYYRMLNKVKQQNYDLHGLRCTLQYKLEIARRFKNYENIYFPHNLDFRGRAYPIPPHFNHLGPDIDRGLLLFARSRPLGENGLFWMKVHLANLFGFNKASFLERIAWTEKHLPQALDSAANPLDGGQWWLEAEDPWQALATCRELREILSLPPEKRKSYESSLPVHMDGSCNGLQHYAALGGDVEGGTQVNLVPGERPGDVYTSVSNIVARKVAEDARNGHELAQVLDGKIERKIVKQTVMTSVYGVTFVGARKQIENALSDRVQLDEELYWGCSAYLAKLTFASLGELFFGARQLMEWLGQCASLIAKSGEPVVFTTPFNLPVMQPYRQTRKAKIQTVLQRITMIQSSDDFPINTQKQKSAFPPNYVHSLDSTHMLLTARDMHKAKLDFSAVHDSYWSHACDVEVMNKYIRKNFIELHQQPLLENLLEEFQTRNPDIDFPPIPPRGNLDLKVVMDSPYFFH